MNARPFGMGPPGSVFKIAAHIIRRNKKKSPYTIEWHVRNNRECEVTIGLGEKHNAGLIASFIPILVLTIVIVVNMANRKIMTKGSFELRIILAL